MTQSCDSHQTLDGNILVAEDDHIGQLLLKKILAQAGYKADFVADGKAAIAALKSNHYSLVLMDCLMPRMDGFETTRYIRNTNSFHINPKIPIIALSGLSGPEDQLKCLHAGMNFCLTKPVDADTLIATIEQYLGPLQNKRPASHQNKLQADQIQEDAFLNTIIGRFLEETPLVISDLQRAAKHGDIVELQHIGHRLRGVADILEASTLSTRSQALERAGKTENLTLACKLAAQLINELQKLSAALTE